MLFAFFGGPGYFWFLMMYYCIIIGTTVTNLLTNIRTLSILLFLTLYSYIPNNRIYILVGVCVDAKMSHIYIIQLIKSWIIYLLL